MSQPISLTRRLILTLTVGAALLWVLGALATILVVRGQLDRTLDGGLREIAERLLPLAVDSATDDHDGDAYVEGGAPLDQGGGEYIVYQLRQPDGTIAMRSHDAPEVPFAAPLSEGFATTGPWRIYTAADRESGLSLQVAEALRFRDDALWGSVLALLLPVVALVPIAALGIFLAVRAGLVPLRRLGDEIARRDAANLAPIQVGNLPTELSPIADAVQGLLSRLRAALEAERAFAANSAHELRTPIAGSLAQTQRLVAELDGHAAQPRARRVEDSLHRLRLLAAKLLELSRADAGMARAARPIDLLPALALVVDDARRHLDTPSRLEFEIAPGVRLIAPVDIDAFGIIARNLIDNGLHHGDPNAPVRVVVPADNLMEVRSAGPVVAPDRLAILTHRFERGETQAAGSGLGLAIVDTIMRQVGGRLELLSPAPGQPDGFVARLHFPPQSG